MTETEYLELDPSELKIDETNERKANVGPHSELGDLEKSVEEHGVLQPIIVREVDGELRVVAGQRRTLAAQNTGQETIPAVKKDVGESDARAISIIENDSELRKDVPRKDRARATRALVEELGSQRKAAEKLGVSQGAVSRRLETTREEWSETIFDAEKESEFDTEDLSNQTLSAIRSVTGAGDDGEKIGKKIINERIPKQVVEEAVEKSQTTQDLEDNLDELLYDTEGDLENIEANISFKGSSAEAIGQLAKKRGKSTDDLIEQLILDRLSNLGYFSDDDGRNADLMDFM